MNAAAQRRAIAEAVAELARRVYERDQLPPEERSDPRAFAAEVVTGMHGHGWRLTNARRRSSWISTPIRDNTATTARGAAMARQLLERGPNNINEEEGT
ncbi:hypothetical protein [Nonomuraea lactucae]|uniref:hypothetical protein n=1 Tax=Nonomuraea lactucae TaxID=2249762 RepID=UPI000DE2AA8E|nr:hypothetical protein [Nonomuraea lactucae]